MRVAARRVLLVVLALALVVGGGVLGGASASAEVVHNFEFSFDGHATPNGSFKEGSYTVAIDQTSGDVYVENWQAGAVYRFDAAGTYLGEITGAAVPQGSLGLFGQFSGLAVDNSAGANKGDLYVAGTGNGVVYRFDSSGKLLSELNGSGTPAGSFGPRGVAVDSSGDLYVADGSNGVVDKFDASGNYVSQISSLYVDGSTATIAVDSGGDVYLTKEEAGVVKLEPGGGVSVLDAHRAGAVAVDPATDHVYVAEVEYPSPAQVAEYDSSGNRLGVFGKERFGPDVFGVAVHGATGEVYASDTNSSVIDVFGPAVVIADATTEAASNVQPSSATFNGTVNPGGVQVTGCQFEYGTSTSYGQNVPCVQSPASIGSGTSPVTVSADPSGLRADTEYHFRLVASNANGTNHGADLTFVTPGPPRIDGESTTSVNRTTASLQGQIDPFGFDTTYRFEYGTSTSYGTSVPVPDADIGSGMGDVPVSQNISGLLPGVSYHYRIVATNSQASVDGSDQTLTTVPPAYIDGEFATDVASTSATINAKVNPIGSNTEYRFEYGTSTSYGQILTGNAGEGTTDVLVSYHRQELQPGTTYHYRIVTTNVFGTVEGADHTFTTQVAGSELTLLDGRAWELVSPPDKKAGLIGVFVNGTQAADNGSGITYLERGIPIGDNPVGSGADNGSQILSERGPGGWKSDDISLPQSTPKEGESTSQLFTNSSEYGRFSPDLSWAVASPGSFTSLSSEALEGTAYLRNNRNGSFAPFLTRANVPSGIKLGKGREGVWFFVSTPDLSHDVIGSWLALTPEAVGGKAINLYEWAGGSLQLVNVLPSGEPTQSEVIGADLAGSTEVGPGDAARAVSADGRRVAWTWGHPYDETVVPYRGLFVRDMAAKKTVQVGGSDALYQTMSSDGSRILFLENGDLYEFDMNAGTQTDLTANHGAGETSAGVKEAVSDVSEDGAYVYFVATGVLANGAVSGEDNLYLAHDNGGAWSTRYIATLSHEDEKDWYAQIRGATYLNQVSSRVSPDGRYLAFMSERPLTGYDNTDAVSGQPDDEVYLYDATAGRLVCASCDQTGARPAGVLDSGELLVDLAGTWTRGGSTADTSHDHWLAGSIPGWTSAHYQPRYLSDTGRLFFNSPDALVPQDTNGFEDVYEYEPAGAGGCKTGDVTFSERSGGCVGLISSGTSASDSAFFDASETGDDVFFITASRLTAADYDTAYDVYDAHACSTTVPCVTVPVSPPACTSGDSCKAAPSPQPEVFGPAPSATFSGEGNVVGSPSKPVVTPKSLTRAQKLARALHACRKKSGKAKRAVCERQARTRYRAKQSRNVNATKKGNR